MSKKSVIFVGDGLHFYKKTNILWEKKIIFLRSSRMSKLIKVIAILAACVISAFGVYCLMKTTVTDENTAE